MISPDLALLLARREGPTHGDVSAAYGGPDGSLPLLFVLPQ
jgi:hypothetical protein